MARRAGRRRPPALAHRAREPDEEMQHERSRRRGRRCGRLAEPSPNRSLTASLASAPPVNGSPPRLSASAAVTISASDRRRPPSAAATPTVRNSAAFTRT